MDPSPKNYSASIDVPSTPTDCFEAISNRMSEWWTTSVHGQISKAGDVVRVEFPPNFGHWTFKAVEVASPRRLEIICIDAHHTVEGQPEQIDREWMNTRIEWQFTANEAGTRISMTHHGLTPELHCWDICLDGWNYFFTQSLKNLLSGQPPSPHEG